MTRLPTAGGSLQAAAFLGSFAAALEAQSLGNAPISAAQLLDAEHRESLRKAS